MVARFLGWSCGIAVLATATAGFAQTGYVSGQPSIDCSKAVSTLNLIRCSGPEVAKVDWDLTSAVWAIYFTLPEGKRDRLDDEQRAWRQSISRGCNLPRQETQEEKAAREMARMFGRTWGMNVQIPPPPEVTQAHISSGPAIGDR